MMAASAVLHLQSTVRRQMAPDASVVLTIGEFHAATAENIIPDEAYIKLNVRTTDEAVRNHVMEAIRRICIAEALASNAPREPEIEVINNYPLTVNDAEVTKKVSEAFRNYFGESAKEVPPEGASEDFNRFGRAGRYPICSGLWAAQHLKNTIRPCALAHTSSCLGRTCPSGRLSCIPR